MSVAGNRTLRGLARACGVQTSHVDVAGRRHEASPEAIRSVLAALDVAAESDADAAASLLDLKRKHLNTPLDPVLVAWDGARVTIELRCPEARITKPFQIRLINEGGRARSWSVRPDRLRTIRSDTVDRTRFRTVSWTLPTRLPTGYHELELSTDSGRFSSSIISAPTASWQSDVDRREWGVFVPTYAIRSQGGNSIGCGGDLGDLGRLSRWLGREGGSVVATLPLLAAFLETPFEPSPYSPASRLFWNEFYLDLEQIPGAQSGGATAKALRSAAWQREAKRLRDLAEVDYRAQTAHKRSILERSLRELLGGFSERRAAFDEHVRSRPELADYARFRAVLERRRKPWSDWPSRMRDGQLTENDYAESSFQYHLYVQWLAEEQIGALARETRDSGATFYLDLPLGVHGGGYDVWRERRSFALTANGGAPPDSVFTRGQDWGFAPLHPTRIREDGFGYVRRFVRHHLRHAGLLRVDHVMGLHRLWWVPRGRPASEGAYVQYPADELYAILNLESHRHRARIVGENLGTVPAAVNRSMRDHRIREMYVVQYEQRPDPARALPKPPSASVASLNTHDMPPFAAHWNGDDIADRKAMGLLRGREVTAEKRRRSEMNAALIQFLRKRRFLAKTESRPELIMEACLDWLGATDAELVLMNLEDLWGETLPQNVPGTGQERPNWRRKTRYTLEEIGDQPAVRRILDRIRTHRHAQDDLTI